MKSRHELREAVFKILFQIENTELDYKELLELEQEEIANSSYVNNTLTEIIDKLEEIDNIISNNLKDWKLERLSKMDRQILRISAYEILHSDIPYKVSINEAVELSKKYSEKDESYKFINGVLKGIVETSTK
ncbi:transcription antitermination factor NusB [Gemella morbillorum]|jgi:transcription antitermination factor nusB|uniref:Transcription antitermination protein NusB n=1 Tax=Gemella morbillorum TaxID=29391 RepID=A0AAP9HEM3_9BACL|nr:transcription antitermination factor NusB [Gemella morbillorum]EFV36092.1 transcription antitermination factor NusB [Gemella morbillorum M424]MDK8239483.1 transcription antitermination factor NusB [Gemella morbillorum]MDK8255749.1 transcription antitermination factor NusB [Gemella morbillorum]QGS09399.1 transcription antitermination factor NusB [Gemella morbillorum]